MEKMEVIIRVNEAGQISVTGAIEKPLVCFGLLECAKQVVADYHREKMQRLAPPANVIAEALRSIKQ